MNKQPAFRFYGHDLRDAEEMLVGACIRDEATLVACLERLPEPAFGSERAEILTRLMAPLARLHSLGAFDPETNEHLLILGLANQDAAGHEDFADRFAERLLWWGDEVDSFWTPWAIVPGWTAALLDAVVEMRRLELAAITAWQDFLNHAPLAVTDVRLDSVLLAIREAAERRLHAQQQRSEYKPAPPPVGVDWEGIRKRVRK